MVEHAVVVGDIGGTNCRLELLRARVTVGVGVESELLFGATTATASGGSLTALLHLFLQRPEVVAAMEPFGKSSPSACVLAVCGPVVDGKSILLAPSFGEGGWHLDASEISSAIGCEVVLLNGASFVRSRSCRS